jgi:glucosaminylphosphatidylinositol acyltransferase
MPLFSPLCRYLSMFRAGLTTYTCIAILAVDFRIFPRRFAKAETYGQGLMDLGPGLFVFSAGLTLGSRLSRPAPGDRRVAAWSLLQRAARGVGPLVVLGLGRLLLTNAVDYQVRAAVRAARLLCAQLVRCQVQTAPSHDRICVPTC